MKFWWLRFTCRVLGHAWNTYNLTEQVFSGTETKWVTRPILACDRCGELQLEPKDPS